MRVVFRMTFAALILPVVFGCAQPPVAQPSWLFVMRATAATLTKTSAGFEIDLKNIDPQTIQFADRPVRKAKIINTTKFINNWSTGAIFKISQPNGAIVFDGVLDANGEAEAVAVELKNPISVGANAWTFQLKDLAGTLTAGDYKGVSIFIDNTTTDSPYTRG